MKLSNMSFQFKRAKHNVRHKFLSLNNSTRASVKKCTVLWYHYIRNPSYYSKADSFRGLQDLIFLTFAYSVSIRQGWAQFPQSWWQSKCEGCVFTLAGVWLALSYLKSYVNAQFRNFRYDSDCVDYPFDTIMVKFSQQMRRTFSWSEHA